jgi:alpha-N-arabinofuranosidase
VVATFLNAFVNHAHIVKIANMAQLVNVIAPMFTNDQGMFLQTIYYPLQLFAVNTKGRALELYHDGPKYKSTRFDDVPYLDTSASVDSGTLVINVVNRHKDQTIEAEVEVQDKQFTGPVAVSEVNGPDIKAENDFGKTTVKAVTKPASADGHRLRYSFPPHSYTMLKAKVS